MLNAELEKSLNVVRGLLESGAAIKDVDDAIANVSGLNERNSIGPLLLMLNDESDYDEVMFSIIHAAENFSDSDYVYSLLKIIPKMRVSNPRWASIVLMRIINNEAAKKELIIATAHALPEEKNAIALLCESINKVGVDFVSKTIPLIAAARV
ncbi:hypothetical protein EYC55_22350 [Xanthomonas oryzae]|uniref:Imm30 family immunity protein n=1 Tax=Xanthomonas oryzae TaxID=347 RepID=UPI001034AD9E|nr:Imm30 family immunity protein [Xanthomonas oryzae]QBG97575.1 hypothetical protein EYC55_22350 [Xanthomonas oryzae]